MPTASNRVFKNLSEDLPLPGGNEASVARPRLTVPRWAVVIGALALYAASIPFFLGAGGIRLTMGSIVPIVIAGWAYGRRAGILAGVLGYPINALIVWAVLGTAAPFLTSIAAGVASVVSMGAAWTVGYLSESRARSLHRDDFVASALVKAFEHSPIGMAILSSSGGFELVNPSFARMFGRSSESLRRLNWFDLASATKGVDEQQTIMALLRAPVDSLEFGVEYRARDGELRHGTVFLSTIQDSGVGARHHLLQLMDTTELRRANSELQETIDAKDEFIASISHELRTPLTAVAGLARELRDRIDDFTRAQIADFAEIMTVQSNELANIVEDFMVHVRGTAGWVRIVLEPVELATVARDLIATWNEGVGAPLLQHTDEPVVAIADRMRLRQILRNLLQNAARHGADPIRVEIHHRGEYGYVNVIDSGDGVPRSNESELFEPHNGSRSNRGVTESLGLGLHISSTLAHLMGGDIAYSHSNGETRFQLSLPRADFPRAESSTPSTEARVEARGPTQE